MLVQIFDNYELSISIGIHALNVNTLRNAPETHQEICNCNTIFFSSGVRSCFTNTALLKRSKTPILTRVFLWMLVECRVDARLNTQLERSG